MSEDLSLIVGATGQLGRQMMHVVGASALPATRSVDPPNGWLHIDLATLSKPEDAELLLDGRQINAIYCLAGMTNVDGCEDHPERSRRTNCRGPEVLALAASRRGIPFVYFSTEYVFDGDDGPYHEQSRAHPLNVYGESKWEGELAVLAAHSAALIVRTTVVYGQDSGEKNYIYSLMRALGAGNRMRVPEDQVSTPTYNRDLAGATVALVSRGASGIFNVCGPERMGRLEFARRVADFLALDTALLEGLPTHALAQKAPRPLSAGLAIDKLCRLHPDLKMRTLDEALEDCKGDLEKFLIGQR